MAVAVNIVLVILGLGVKECLGQGASAFDYGYHREGQLSGELSPLNIFAIVLACLAAFVAFGITLTCAYVTWKRYNEEREVEHRVARKQPSSGYYP